MIYEVGPKDYDTLLDVWVSAVDATHHFLSKEDYEFYKTHVPIYFNHLDLYAYKDDKGQISAFIGISEDNMIDMLFVHNNVRGKGIGKILLNYAVDKLDARRVDVNEQNKQALDFYYHFGFEEIGRSEYDGEGKAYPILHLEKKK
ncbi:GNAT family N-acetyltransferase [Dysgonomonas massiliensis]|uniref:GNAT family N-acetyltransferase n=1 Tax=Dysgonomonas massiliensis TaxID=2040292 RepID=UPI000C791945|nr:GNAT family N-acetyltransferase [Dysgonomonas massiliensis]